MATIVNTLKGILKEQGYKEFSKSITKPKIKIYTINSLCTKFGLGILNGMTNEELADDSESAIYTFKENFLSFNKPYVEIVATSDNSDFSITNLSDNLLKMCLDLEDATNISETLKQSIDVDVYLTGLIKDDKLGIIAVKSDDSTYYYLFKQVHALVTQSVINELKALREKEEPSSEDQEKYRKLYQTASESYKLNKGHLTYLDNYEAKRALYDDRAREISVLTNTLRVMFG